MAPKLFDHLEPTDGRTFEELHRFLTGERNENHANRITKINKSNITLLNSLDFDWMVNKVLPWPVKLNDGPPYKNFDAIEEWLMDNCLGRYYGNYGSFRFEIKDDAIRFKMTWM